MRIRYLIIFSISAVDKNSTNPIIRNPCYFKRFNVSGSFPCSMLLAPGGTFIYK